MNAKLRPPTTTVKQTSCEGNTPHTPAGSCMWLPFGDASNLCHKQTVKFASNEHDKPIPPALSVPQLTTDGPKENLLCPPTHSSLFSQQGATAHNGFRWSVKAASDQHHATSNPLCSNTSSSTSPPDATPHTPILDSLVKTAPHTLILGSHVKSAPDKLHQQQVDDAVSTAEKMHIDMMNGCRGTVWVQYIAPNIGKGGRFLEAALGSSEESEMAQCEGEDNIEERVRCVVHVLNEEEQVLQAAQLHVDVGVGVSKQEEHVLPNPGVHVDVHNAPNIQRNQQQPNHHHQQQQHAQQQQKQDEQQQHAQQQQKQIEQQQHAQQQQQQQKQNEAQQQQKHQQQQQQQQQQKRNEAQQQHEQQQQQALSRRAGESITKEIRLSMHASATAATPSSSAAAAAKAASAHHRHTTQHLLNRALLLLLITTAATSLLLAPPSTPHHPLRLKAAANTLPDSQTPDSDFNYKTMYDLPESTGIWYLDLKVPLLPLAVASWTLWLSANGDGWMVGAVGCVGRAVWGVVGGTAACGAMLGRVVWGVLACLLQQAVLAVMWMALLVANWALGRTGMVVARMGVRVADVIVRCLGYAWMALAAAGKLACRQRKVRQQPSAATWNGCLVPHCPSPPPGSQAAAAAAATGWMAIGGRYLGGGGNLQQDVDHRHHHHQQQQQQDEEDEAVDQQQTRSETRSEGRPACDLEHEMSEEEVQQLQWRAFQERAGLW